MVVRGVDGTQVDSDAEEQLEGRYAFVGLSPRLVVQVWSPPPPRESRESREERVGPGEVGLEERLEELASRAADLLPFMFNSDSPPPLRV